MTKVQLYTRLGKIEHIDKLEKFVRVAREFGYRDLEIAAQGKLDTMQNNTLRQRVTNINQTNRTFWERQNNSVYRFGDNQGVRVYSQIPESDRGLDPAALLEREAERKPKPAEKKLEKKKHVVPQQHKRSIEF
jgi:hypothetical protein